MGSIVTVTIVRGASRLFYECFCLNSKMPDLSKSDLQTEVKAILEGADLSTVTAKSVRKQIEEKLDVDLSDRRKEIDAIIMAAVDEKASSEEEISEEEDEAPKRKGAKKSDDEEYAPGSKKSKPKAKPKKRKADSDDDNDAEWSASKKKKTGGPRKATAFTKSFKLSPELADVVGADVMPRHEVIKKMWAVIKERKLQDPSQKQFAICDEQLLKVIGVKRFKTFGMMKYLKNHFVEAVN